MYFSRKGEKRAIAIDSDKVHESMGVMQVSVDREGHVTQEHEESPPLPPNLLIKNGHAQMQDE